MFWIFLCLIPSIIFASSRELPEFSAEGNLSLPFSQQPGPLVSFGENVIDQGQVQLLLFADAVLGKRNYATEAVPAVLYGITNDLSLFFNVPVSTGNKMGHHHSAGLEDIFAQFEYAFYNKPTYDTMSQATIVANVSFPTGSSKKTPATGYGTYGFFLGATYNHMRVDWFFFSSAGTTLTGSRHKAGYKYYYEFGFGKNIATPKGWLLAWLIEFDGIYSEGGRARPKSPGDSGGNIIYVTPSLWASSERYILQFGVGYPALQQVKGDDSRQYVTFDLNLVITL